LIFVTDSNLHFDFLGKFRLKMKNAKVLDAEVKLMALKMALLCGDLGYTAQRMHQCRAWIGLLWEEYFIQSDIEKQLGITVTLPYERGSGHLYKSYATFSEHICIPMFEAWSLFVDSDEFDRKVIKQAKKNL
jgi:hypothetical protein